MLGYSYIPGSMLNSCLGGWRHSSLHKFVCACLCKMTICDLHVGKNKCFITGPG